MTKSAKPDYSKIDVHQLLQRRRQIAVIWSIEDVQEVRPDLNAKQAWAVLRQCERVHDCSVGFSWELLQYVAEDLFPLPQTREE
jgi:hypothetical protein